MFVTPCSSLHGGVETILHELCRCLPDYGWDVELALASGHQFNLYDRYVAEYPDLNTHMLKPRAYNTRARVAAIVNLVKDRKPDLIVATRISDTFEAVSWLKSRGWKVRLGVAIRSMEAGYIQDLLNWRSFVDVCFADGNLLSAACTSIANIDSNRVHNLPGGVHIPLVARPASPDPTSLRLGYVGRLSNSDKSVFDLVQLLNSLDLANVRYTLDVFGTGPDAVELHKRLMNEDRIPKVRFHGWKSNQELYEEAYPFLDVLLNFSSTEGVTISPREAMVNGVVPVVSRFPGLLAENIFRDGVNSLTFEVGDIDGAVASVKQLLFDTRLLQRLSAAAKQSQPGIYNFEGSIRAWVEALNACLRAPICVGQNIPKQKISSRLERWGLPSFLADDIRSLLFWRRQTLNCPGDEWPHITTAASSKVEQSLISLQSRLDTGSFILSS